MYFLSYFISNQPRVQGARMNKAWVNSSRKSAKVSLNASPVILRKYHIWHKGKGWLERKGTISVSGLDNGAAWANKGVAQYLWVRPSFNKHNLLVTLWLCFYLYWAFHSTWISNLCVVCHCANASPLLSVDNILNKTLSLHQFLVETQLAIEV